MPRTFTVNLSFMSESFAVWCAARGLSRSAAIRQLVSGAMADDKQTSWLSPPELIELAGPWDATVQVDDAPRHQVSVRLSQTQHNHLRLRAAAAGLSCSRYIVAAITARDNDAETIAGKDAVEALNRSNDLLARSALSLAAWRRGGPGGASSPGPQTDAVEEILAVLREHLALAATVISDVQLTRVGRAPRGQTRRRVKDARSAETGHDPRAVR